MQGCQRKQFYDITNDVLNLKCTWSIYVSNVLGSQGIDSYEHYWNAYVYSY